MGGALGTPDSDYEFYLPEYVGHGFAKMVIKTISIATNLDPGPFQSVNYSTHLCIHIIKSRDKGISQIVKTQESNGFHKTALGGSGCCRLCRLNLTYMKRILRLGPLKNSSSAPGADCKLAAY